MLNKNVQFPYYSGNIKFSKAMGIVNLKEFINAHKSPSSNTVRILKEVDKATKAKDFKLKRKLKHGLYSFTPNVKIPIGSKRKYDNIVTWTGLMQLDFDKISTKEEAVELKEYIFKNQSEVICCYLSPSGLGIKALIKIPICRDTKHYKAIHRAMVNEFQKYSYLDEATNNAVLPLFLSADKNILHREYEEASTFLDEDWNQVNYERLNSEPTPTSIEPDNNKTAAIFMNKIKNIIDNGHPQLRSACLILGSRAAAGYIDLTDAKSLAIASIYNNSYFSKGIGGYKDTVEWAIEQGFKTPKYY